MLILGYPLQWFDGSTHQTITACSCSQRGLMCWCTNQARKWGCWWFLMILMDLNGLDASKMGTEMDFTPENGMKLPKHRIPPARGAQPARSRRGVWAKPCETRISLVRESRTVAALMSVWIHMWCVCVCVMRVCVCECVGNSSIRWQLCLQSMTWSFGRGVRVHECREEVRFLVSVTNLGKTAKATAKRIQQRELCDQNMASWKIPKFNKSIIHPVTDSINFILHKWFISYSNPKKTQKSGFRMVVWWDLQHTSRFSSFVLCFGVVTPQLWLCRLHDFATPRSYSHQHNALVTLNFLRHPNNGMTNLVGTCPTDVAICGQHGGWINIVRMSFHLVI